MRQTNTQKILRRSGIPVICRYPAAAFCCHIHMLYAEPAALISVLIAEENIAALKKKKKDFKIFFFFSTKSFQNASIVYLLSFQLNPPGSFFHLPDILPVHWLDTVCLDSLPGLRNDRYHLPFLF